MRSDQAAVCRPTFHIRYPSRRAALAESRVLGQFGMVYRCRFCVGWHIGIPVQGEADPNHPRAQGETVADQQRLPDDDHDGDHLEVASRLVRSVTVRGDEVGAATAHILMDIAESLRELVEQGRPPAVTDQLSR